ncbi:hybrid sensor histidine kinase/response regulator [Calditerrivibrio nitroreducens]|uniref:histidine kinase n=1 Tax=Calditerrivibrio nitroreducens (strain DSM 19672 / NBRC 101217 / Yu37-1) TaxID=768670 RepID=E4TGV0_CALNY|nr:ATP-binding protein [Calditerrivibrio nitroreducens]ADR18710.1 histidine kinase [Calditerrivibrio nitroreducens DSM 19672]
MSKNALDIIKDIFGDAINITPNIYLLLDDHYNILFANGSFLKKFKFTDARDVVGKKISDIIKSSSIQTFLTKIRDEEYVYNYELIVGEEEQIFFTANVYNKFIDNRFFYLLMMRDTSEDVKREMELHRLTMELEDAKDEILKSREKLVQQEKLVSIGMLAAGIAHEINNPLGFIKSNFETLVGYAKMLLSAIDKMNELIVENQEIVAGFNQVKKSNKIDFIAEDLGDLEKDSEGGFKRIIDIINALRNFSRQEMDKKDLYLLSEIIEESLTITHNKTKHVAQVEKDINGDLEIVCSKTEIVQVLINLIVNAAHALEEVEKENKRIIVRGYTDGQYAVIEVEDNGPGIPKHIKNKIFDPFFTTKPVGKGTGLGLYISYDIVVNKHSGMLEMETAEGVGTTFRIKIPKNLESKKIKVLVVDDFESVADALANGLNATDKYVAEISTSGFDAGVKIHSMKPDVVLLDYHMPGINGYDVAKKIKESKDTKDIKIIVYSGNFDKEIIKNLKSLGVDYILHKPFFVSELCQIIDAIMVGGTDGNS